MLKKALAMLLCGVLLFTTMGVTAFAVDDYNVHVSGKTITLLLGGKTVSSYQMKSNAIRIRSNDKNELQVCYYDAGDNYKAINMKSQKTVNVSGNLDKVEILKSLSPQVNVNLDSNSLVGSLIISDRGSVSIWGTVTNVTINGDADVNVLKGGSVSSASITAANASLFADTGSSVKSVSKVSNSRVGGSGIGSVTITDRTTTNNNKWADPTPTPTPRNIHYNVALQYSTGNLSTINGNHLEDMTYELANNVTAYVNDTRSPRNGEYISGSFVWRSSPYTVVQDGVTYGFTFIPDDYRYNNVNGTMRMTVYWTGLLDPYEPYLDGNGTVIGQGASVN